MSVADQSLHVCLSVVSATLSDRFHFFASVVLRLTVQRPYNWLWLYITKLSKWINSALPLASTLLTVLPRKSLSLPSYFGRVISIFSMTFHSSALRILSAARWISGPSGMVLFPWFWLIMSVLFYQNAMSIVRVNLKMAEHYGMLCEILPRLLWWPCLWLVCRLQVALVIQK